MSHIRDQRGIGLGRFILALAIAAALVLGIADVAQASLFLEFDRTHGRPGTVVHVRTAGDGACTVCPHRLRLYFVQARFVDDITSPDDLRLVLVGRLKVDGDGNGTGRLTVPMVVRGRYEVMTYCKPCAPGSGGRTMLPLGPDPPFRVR
jgi:hypothetical protein